MKKLVISVKSTSKLLSDAKKAFKDVKKNKKKAGSHYEIAFTDMKEFRKFINHIDVLTAIQMFRPNSIYELANIMDKDTANLNRIINFYESIGAITTKEKIVKGRAVKTPIVGYSKIELDLAA
ncbi:MAG: hypothetical protein ACPGJV_02095 [Bacteriovoracaceae bacterium]